MQEGRASFGHGLAELFEREILPLLNLMVLLLPLVLFGIELVTRSAISVTLPDAIPDVASLDTPPVPRRGAPSDHHGEAPSHSVPQAWVGPTPTATAPSVFSDSPLGYGD